MTTPRVSMTDWTFTGTTIATAVPTTTATATTWTLTVLPMDEVVNAFHGLAAACRELAEALR